MDSPHGRGQQSGGRNRLPATSSICGAPFREFTVIFHDEIPAEQAFPELADEVNPLHPIKDGMGINYGASSMGSLVRSTKAMKKNVGPARNSPECRAEEFFLSFWANGDPALLLAMATMTSSRARLIPTIRTTSTIPTWAIRCASATFMPGPRKPMSCTFTPTSGRRTPATRT